MFFCYVNHVDNLLISHPQCNEFIFFILTAEDFFFQNQPFEFSEVSDQPCLIYRVRPVGDIVKRNLFCFWQIFISYKLLYYSVTLIRAIDKYFRHFELSKSTAVLYYIRKSVTYEKCFSIIARARDIMIHLQSIQLLFAVACLL